MTFLFTIKPYMTFLFIIKPYMTFLFISSYLVPNFTVYDAVKNQVPKHFYDVPVYDFKYDLPVVFYDVPIFLILRCPRLYDVPVYDVPVYDCNSSYRTTDLEPRRVTKMCQGCARDMDETGSLVFQISELRPPINFLIL